MPLRLATYNIHRCVGIDRVEKPERIAAVLQEINADIVALQEVSCALAMPRNTTALLAEAAGARVIEGFTLIEKKGHYGNVLLTRLEVSQVERTYQHAGQGATRRSGGCADCARLHGCNSGNPSGHGPG